MSEVNALSERIDALEIRLTFQDETIETLNQTIMAQWQQIDALTRQLAQLKELARETESNATDPANLRIPCTTAHSAASQFDGCPDHMATATDPSPIAGQRAVSFDVAAWSDLWFYSNPVYIQVIGSVVVAGVK